MTVVFSLLQLTAELPVETVQQICPVLAPLGNDVQIRFHVGGKVVIHQVMEILNQTVSNNIAHFLSVETTTLQRNITTILNGRDNRGIG